MNTSNYLQLEKELAAYIDVLSSAADVILDQEISLYPIFVVHKEEMEIGVPVIQKENRMDSWSVQASSLEEFVSKQLIEPNKLDSFKTIYKDPAKHLCLFVVSSLGANFIFLKRNNN
jgi:hypothetical protein